MKITKIESINMGAYYTVTYTPNRLESFLGYKEKREHFKINAAGGYIRQSGDLTESGSDVEKSLNKYRRSWNINKQTNDKQTIK